MTTATTALRERPAWQALHAHHASLRDVHLRSLFAEDPRRGERFALEAAGLHLDYSKHRITQETLRLLFALAEECGLRARIDAMFRGEKINATEGRAVLHVALRAPREQTAPARWAGRRREGPRRARSHERVRASACAAAPGGVTRASASATS